MRGKGTIMNSKKSGINSEESLYEPIRENLMGVFSRYIIRDKKPHLQSAPDAHEEERLYLEITGKKKKFNEKLKKGSDNETLNIINSEGKFPDITGYVKQKQNSEKELITVEIKKALLISGM